MVQVTSRGPEKGSATASSNRRRRRMEGQKDYEQEKSMGKGQVPSMMEGMHRRRRHLGEQRKFEEYNGVGQRIQKGISQRRRRGSKMTRGRRR